VHELGATAPMGGRRGERSRVARRHAGPYPTADMAKSPARRPRVGWPPPAARPRLPELVRPSEGLQPLPRSHDHDDDPVFHGSERFFSGSPGIWHGGCNALPRREPVVMSTAGGRQRLGVGSKDGVGCPRGLPHIGGPHAVISRERSPRGDVSTFRFPGGFRRFRGFFGRTGSRHGLGPEIRRCHGLPGESRWREIGGRAVVARALEFTQTAPTGPCCNDRRFGRICGDSKGFSTATSHRGPRVLAPAFSPSW